MLLLIGVGLRILIESTRFRIENRNPVICNLRSTASIRALIFALALSATAVSLKVGAEPCAPCQHNSDGAFNLETAPFEMGAESTTLQAGANSTTLQGGAASTTLQGGAASTMLQAGTASTTLQTGTTSTLLNAGTQSTMLQAGVERQSLPVNVLILLDSSQTMKQNLNGELSSAGEEKLSAAKRGLAETLKIIPSDVNVGLRVFGQAGGGDSGSDCQQTALLVPMGQKNRAQIVQRTEELHPYGMTPLAFTLMKAAGDFRGLTGVNHILLVSDGFETCGGNPCAYIRQLIASGFHLKIDIIGVGLKRDRIAKEHLSCLTEASGGKYYDADTSAQLAQGIKDSFLRAVGEGKVSGKVLTRIAPHQEPAAVVQSGVLR